MKKISLYFVCSILFCSFISPISAGESISVPSVGIKKIGQAMISAQSGDTIRVADGKYNERVYVKSGVILMARNPLKAIIIGDGKGTVVTLNARCTIDGFIIKNGTMGVFSKEAGNAIVNCQIVQNWGTGIVCVRQLPKIEDNVIAFNRASGIQGWDIRSTSYSINHNTIAYNGNHGIALGGNSEAVIENNVIAFNERLGIKLSPRSSSTKLTKNNFFGNLLVSQTVPPENVSFDPKFTKPRTDFNFKMEAKEMSTLYGTDEKLLGKRGFGE